MEEDKEILKKFGVPEDIEVSSFNCLGFAVGIFRWIPKGDLTPESDDRQIERMIHEINSFSPGHVRLIQQERELRENEYLCVVFVESSRDFLHAVRKSGQRWIEKNGHEEITYLAEGINPLEDLSCSWSVLCERCKKPKQYLLGVNTAAPITDYKYMSHACTYSYIKIGLRCEPYEIYDLPYGLAFYDDEEAASIHFIGAGSCLWKICLQNIDKSIASTTAAEEGTLFNQEDYMLEILSVQEEEENTYRVNAKPVLVQDVLQQHRVMISLASQLEDYLPFDRAFLKVFI